MPGKKKGHDKKKFFDDVQIQFVDQDATAVANTGVILAKGKGGPLVAGKGELNIWVADTGDALAIAANVNQQAGDDAEIG